LPACGSRSEPDRTMTERTARFLSFLFHPLILPCLALAVMMVNDPVVMILLPVKMKLLIFAMVIITTILVPLLLVFMTWRLGVIQSFYMRSREERAIPMLLIAVFYYLAYYLLKGIHLPQIFHMYMLGATLMMIILIVLNFFRKVSLHMAGLGAFTGLMAGMAFQYGVNTSWLILSGILLSGLVGSARLKLNAHQPSDLLTGWLTGASILFLTGFLF
jgi:hypothetical protein